MNDRESENASASSWNNPNWATDKEWVRAAAQLEAETGVEFLIGADLANNLAGADVAQPTLGERVVPSRIDLERLSAVINDGLTGLLPPDRLSVLVAETHAFINERVQSLTTDRSHL